MSREEWKKDLADHKYEIMIAIVLVGIALTLNYAAGNYVNRVGAVVASDAILDNIPPIDLSFIFIWGYILVVVLYFAYAVFWKPKQLHVAISQFGLLVLVRSFFMSLTHLKAPADAILVNVPVLNLMVFNNDLFFSAHTAIPFLGYLLYRKEKINLFFLIMTFVLAATVLLMHVHYSIDVFAAVFITYGTYTLGRWFFSKIRED